LFTLISSAPGSVPQITVAGEKNKLKATLSGRTLLEYQAEARRVAARRYQTSFRAGGYIQPIFSPSGKMITDDFPPNHIHHHGVWWAWTNTEFDGRHPDFWNMGDGKGGWNSWLSTEAEWSGAWGLHFPASVRRSYSSKTGGRPQRTVGGSDLQTPSMPVTVGFSTWFPVSNAPAQTR